MIRAAKVTGALVALIVLVAALTPVLERAELATIDARFDVRGTQPVGIDEESFSALDTQWPFPRTLHADMIDTLRESGVRQIVYDVPFTEPSESPDDDHALYDAIDRAEGVILADDQGGTRVLGGDEALAEGGARAARQRAVRTADGCAGCADRLPRAAGHDPDVLVRGSARRCGEAA